MLKGYSDYNTITRGYLRNYNAFKLTVENLEQDLKILEEELKAISTPIAKYGEGVAGGYSELNKIEGEADRRIYLRGKAIDHRNNIKKLRAVTDKLDRIFTILPADDLNIIKGYYFERKPWKVVAEEYFISEKWARQKGAKVVKEISDILFGRKTIPEQASLFDLITPNK